MPLLSVDHQKMRTMVQKIIVEEFKPYLSDLKEEMQRVVARFILVQFKNCQNRLWSHTSKFAFRLKKRVRLSFRFLFQAELTHIDEYLLLD